MKNVYPDQDLHFFIHKMNQNYDYTTVFFLLLFLGPKFGPIPLAKKYVFFPILKENSPQNEVFKKKKKTIGKM